MKKTTIHLVSHTHWDREWYLTFQQFRLRLVQLMDHILGLLKNDPDFRFFMLDGQTIVLDDYLQIRPEREAEIQAFVQGGRLIIGPWHILPDEFLVGPESHIRNLLQGDSTARRFGAKMPIGYIPDPFGHIGQMPQILRGFGIDVACVQRGLDDQPCEFWWEAPDGSRVLMAYLRDGYGNAANLPTSSPENFIREVSRARDSLLPHTATQQILFMHGTDHMLPPADTAAAIRYANAQAEDFTILHSTLPAYIEAIHPIIAANPSSLPTIYGEIRSPKRFHLLPGVLSARMWIKQRNNTCEQLLTSWAEPFSTWAEWVSLEHSLSSPSANTRLSQPAAALHQAWLLLMQNHPHDSICGCSIDQVHEEMRPRFDQAEQIGEEITHQSLISLANLVDTLSAPSVPTSSNILQAIVVFNPTLYARADRVMVEVDIPEPARDIEIIDDTGQPVPVQIGRADNHGAKRVQLAWIATDLPGSGYCTYWLCATAQSSHENPSPTKVPALLRPLIPVMEKLSRFSSPKSQASDARTTSRAPFVIENEHLIVEASPTDGTLTITDRRTGAIFNGCNRFLDGGDCGDEYNYAPPWCDTLETPRVKSIYVHRETNSQYIEINLDLQTPLALSEDRTTRSQKQTTTPITTWVALHRGVQRVEIRTILDNTASDHRLRVHFSAPFQCQDALHDGHFELVQRPVGTPAHDEPWAEQPRPEVPQRCFTCVNNDKIGLIVANRGLPEVEVLHTPQGNTEVALTLLRCVGWLSRNDFSTRQGHAGPMLAVPGAQELGLHTFEYALIPYAVHAGTLPPQHSAREYCSPPRAVVTGLHPGLLPHTHCMIQVGPLTGSTADPGNTVVLSAIKQAVDQAAWVFRVYNTSTEPQAVTFTPWRPFSRVWASNLAEHPLEQLAVSDSGQFAITLRGKEIITLLLGDESE